MLDWFHKRLEREKQNRQKKSRKSVARPQKSEKEGASPEKGLVVPTVMEVSGAFHYVLHSPHITEKTTNMQEHNRYVFRIFPGVSSTQVRQAVEEIYKVHVASVRTINLPSKKRRRGRFVGTRVRYPKAVVTLMEGESIEVIPH